MEKMTGLEEQRAAIFAKRQELEKTLQIRKDLEMKYLEAQKKANEEELANIKQYRAKMKERYQHYEDILEMSRKNMELYTCIFFSHFRNRSNKNQS